VPSLAQTRVEGDIWDTYTGAGEPNRYLSGWGVGDNDPDNEPENSSSEEEDGELDLARILVPPKRQNSIQSLRKHLHLQAGTHRDNLGKPKGAARPGIGSRSVTAISIWRDDDNEGEDGEDEDWGQGWRRKRTRRRSHEEGEEEGDRVAVLLDGKSGTGVGKRRRGIPWAQWAGVAS
jgi:hypothetical protein